MTTDPVSGGVVPALSGDQLVAAVPGLASSGIEIEVFDFRRLPGASLTLVDIIDLATEIKKCLTEGRDGVVVTQGTDTIEETAYALDLLLDSGRPVVVTGAMRNPTLAGADGPANLLAAVQVAASQQARDRGCLVVFAEQIHHARWVRKTHSSSVTAFTSPPDTGAVGRVVEGQPRFLGGTTDRTVVGEVSADRLAPVAVVPVTLGDSGELLSLIDDRFAGLVVAAFGVGHVPAALVPILAELAERIPVVLATRTGAGPVLRETYGFAGSEKDLLARGLISAGFLDPYKARILLTLLIASATPRSHYQSIFHAATGGA